MAKIREMRANGVSDNEIARRLRVSRTSVFRWKRAEKAAQPVHVRISRQPRVIRHPVSTAQGKRFTVTITEVDSSRSVYLSVESESARQALGAAIAQLS